MSYDVRDRYGHAYDISILAESAVERLRADGGLVANDIVARWFGLPPGTDPELVLFGLYRYPSYVVPVNWDASAGAWFYDDSNSNPTYSNLSPLEPRQPHEGQYDH